MTTTAREDRKPGPHAGCAGYRRHRSLPRPSCEGALRLVVAAVVVTALGCLLGAWAWNATTSTEEVLAAHEHHPSRRGDHCRRHPTHPDQRRSGSGTAPGFGVRRDHRSARCPRHLRGRADHDRVDDRCADAAGRPVDRRDLADPGAGPSTPACTAATRSGSSSRPAANGDAPTGTPQFTVAEVVDTAIDETTGNTVVNVLVPYADAGVLAARAATGNVALVLDSGAE